MTWIKLTIHPEHDKVLRLADLAESTPDAAFVAAVRWFRWVDAHVENAHTGISLSSFRVVVRWPDDKLALAMLHPSVDWMEKGRDGLLRPTRPDSHFSKSAKQRALVGKRVTQHRYNSVTDVTQNELLDQTRTDKSKYPVQTTTGAQGVPKAVADLRVSASVGRLVQALPDLTVEEIQAVVAEVRTDPNVRNVGIVAAGVLLGRRGQALPSRRKGDIVPSLSGAVIETAGRLAQIRRQRGGTNA